MPIYAYHCPQCHAQREVTHGMQETPKVLCPTCGQFCRKSVSTAPAVLKSDIQETVSTAETTHTARCCEHSACALHRMP